jgi:hypothetical protein
LEIAMRWHAQASPDFLLRREVDNAMLPALEDALAAAKAELDAVEAAAGELSPLAYGKTLTAAATAVQIAQLNVEQAETGLGWLGLDPATFGGEGALWDMPGAPSGFRISQKRLEEMRRTVLRPAASLVSGMYPERQRCVRNDLSAIRGV